MKLLIASTSTVFGKPYLEYIETEIKKFFSTSKNIIFIPFARPGGISWDEYTDTAKTAFTKFGLSITGIHEKESMSLALINADGIFVGGGNTFVLLNELYERQLLGLVQEKIKEGTPYMGSSAGSNILGSSIRTTNDMPIVYPPSFDALNALPFTINPHYIDPQPNSKHMGETRETRIKEFLEFNDNYVVGLREGSYFLVSGKTVELHGQQSARVFSRKEIKEVGSGESFDFLME